MPVNAYRTRDVADIVEERVLVRLHHAETIRAQAGRQPGSRHEFFRVCEILELGKRIEFDSHASVLPVACLQSIATIHVKGYPRRWIMWRIPAVRLITKPLPVRAGKRVRP